jgi:hypothetical protein
MRRGNEAIFALLTTLLFSTANAVESRGPLHPLYPIIYELGRVHEKIAVISGTAGRDTLFAKKLNVLSASTSKVWFDAVVLPIKAAETNLVNHGVVVHGVPPLEGSYQVAKNSHWQNMVNELQELNRVRWVELSLAINADLVAIKQTQDVLMNHKIIRSVPRENINHGWAFAHGSRWSNLRQFGWGVERALECVDFFQVKLKEFGFQPRVDRDGVFHFDPLALKASYGVEKLSNLSVEVQSNVVKRLRELNSKVAMSEPSCISDGVAILFSDSLEAIAGARRP